MWWLRFPWVLILTDETDESKDIKRLYNTLCANHGNLSRFKFEDRGPELYEILVSFVSRVSCLMIMILQYCKIFGEASPTWSQSSLRCRYRVLIAHLVCGQSDDEVDPQPARLQIGELLTFSSFSCIGHKGQVERHLEEKTWWQGRVEQSWKQGKLQGSQYNMVCVSVYCIIM